ncbi:hypothetical protein FGG08_004150 [Glutinoglossum americanum]|uniref:SMODS and SLOG-associating 2TM effector domain-containing protein n=1 Tax=Glutinoglossum americanum TaxID=1670608 RepID=A0A9P8L470_9PEZI|nr:hypothetical protein FGG08_004150 [Glutinoglossum americanum]
MFDNSRARVMSMASRSRQREGDVEGQRQREGVDVEGDATSNVTPPTDYHAFEPIAPSDKLAHFRILIGIHNITAFSAIAALQRPAPNIGIYSRTVHAERRAALEFQIFTVLINGGLGLQIVIAAALTALGASNGSHTAITAFGAFNTVIAGFLTFMKGSGLPNRLKYYQNEWTKVREYIEQRERDFGLESCRLNVEEEVRIVETMYEEVREDVEANTPDSYTSSQARKTRGVSPRPPIAKSSVAVTVDEKPSGDAKKVEAGAVGFHADAVSDVGGKHRDWKGPV